jgi:hypothetical protein
MAGARLLAWAAGLLTAGREHGDAAVPCGDPADPDCDPADPGCDPGDPHAPAAACGNPAGAEPRMLPLVR